MKKTMLLLAMALLPLAAVAQDTVYFCDFDQPGDTAGWQLLNGNQTNYWTIGMDSSMTSNSLFITNVDTNANYYAYSLYRNVVYACRQVVLPRGIYHISYDWRCMGWNGWERTFPNQEEWNNGRRSDYMRVALVPNTTSFTAGRFWRTADDLFLENSVPAGGIAVDGGTPLTEWDWSGSPNAEVPPPVGWHTYECDVVITEADTFMVVFLWINNSWQHIYQPPAAVDNLLIKYKECPAPEGVYIDRLRRNSFDLHWSDLSGGRVSQWLVELCLEPDTQGQGTVYTTNDTSFSFAGLISDTNYMVYIRSMCGTDTLDHAVRLRVHTPCELISLLPYSEDFDTMINNSFVPCWMRLGRDSTDIYCQNGMLHWNNNGYYPVQYVVLRGINTDVLPMSSLQVSFRARSFQNIEVGVMSNPIDINSFEHVATLRNSSEWVQYEVELHLYEGRGNYIALRVINELYTDIDDVMIDLIAPCRMVHSLSVGEVGAANALLTWGVYEGIVHVPDSFEVRVACVDTGDMSAVPESGYLRFMTAEPRCVIPGLAAGAVYRAWVRARCDNDSLSGWQSVRFSTQPLVCLALDSSMLDTVVFSTDTVQTPGVPVRGDYSESYCASVYTSEELHQSGVTTGLVGMDYTFVAGSTDYTISIYVKSARSSTYPSETLTSQELVYGPAHHYGGTNDTVHHYTFDRPYLWDGLNNITIVTMIHHDTLAGAATICNAYSTSANASRTMCRWRDNDPYTPDGISYGYWGYSTYRPTVTFYTMPCGEVEDCLPPNVLTVDSVEPDAAYLSWVPGYQEDSWRVLYRMADDTVWRTADTHVVTIHYRLDSLAPTQQYEVRVMPNCNDDSVYAQTVFATLCADIDSLPLVEDFEDFTLPTLIDGMAQYCWYGNGNGYHIPSASTDYAYGGARSLVLGPNSSLGMTWIVLPPLGVAIDSLQVSFRTFATNDYQLKVGVMTAPTDYSTFVEVEQLSPNRLGTWELQEVSLEPYTGQGKRIALALEGFQYGMYVDDLRVDYLPACPRPRSVTVTGVTGTSATLQWDGPNALVYEVEYGPTGFAQGTGIVVRDPADSVVLTGLDVATTYDVYLRSLCATDTSGWTSVVVFTTVCGKIDRLPYIQNFEVDATLPPCWTSGAYQSYFIPTIVNRRNIENEVTGRSLRMRGFINPMTSYASLPAIDTSRHPIHTLQVTIEADCGYNEFIYDGGQRYDQPHSHYLIVGVARRPNDIATTFTPVDTLVISEVRSLYTVPLAAAAGAGEYITFVTYSTVEETSVLLDSVAVEPIVSCQRPFNLSAYAITDTSATLTWQPYGSAIGGQVEYMPHGMPLGSGTRVDVMGTTLTVAGLMPNSSYDFYVRSLCTADDTSDWCYNPAIFATRQLPATIPYAYNYDSGPRLADSVGEWGNWGTFSNCSVSWYRGMAGGRPTPPSMYVSADSGNSPSTHIRQPVNAVAYRDIDFGSIDTSIILSFSAKVGGMYVMHGSYSYVYYDGLAVFLVDPSVMMEPSSRYYQSPWGWLYNLAPLIEIRGAATWNDYSVRIDSLSGVHRLAFYWFGGHPTVTNATFMGEPAMVDNISLDYYYDPCPPPSNLRVLPTATTAGITWHGAEDGRYRVLLLSANSLLLHSDTVEATNYQYTTLTPGTTYNVRVSRLCPDHETGLVTAAFTTPMCDGGVSDTIGDHEFHDDYYDLPLHNAYNYSYTQQLILASELRSSDGEGGEISSINLLYSGSRTMNAKNRCTIYMGHTTLSSFASAADFVPPEDLEVVYVGSLNCTEGWNRFYFNQPFAYDGTSNLVVAIDDNSGTVQSENVIYYKFGATATTANMALTYYSNTNNVDCSSSTALQTFAGGKGLHNYRTVMSFDICPPNPCQAPRLHAPRVGTDRVLLHWRGNTAGDSAANRYLFGYRVANSGRWVIDNRLLTDTFYTIDNFFFDTDYVYHVRRYCDSDGISNWAIGSFNTGEIPCLPPLDLRVTEVTNNAARLTWTPDGNNISYRVHVWGGGFDTTLNTYLASCRVRGLYAATRYNAAVEVRCEYIDEPSIWSDTITFATPTCPDVTDVTALEVGGNSVLLDWDDDGQPVEWLIEWGLPGFDLGTGILVTADHHPFLLTGLTGETTYDIIVRAVCGDNFVSEGWSSRLTVTTAYSGIDGATDDLRVQLTPNPTSGDMMLALPASIGAVRVEVIDMAGRTLQTYTLPPHTTQATLTTSQLPQGAYYMRVTGDNMSVVKKILKIES